MFDVRHISQVLAGAAVGVLAVGLVTAPGAAGRLTSANDAVPPGQVASAQKAAGWLKVVVNRSRTYTVVGDGFEQSASATTRFTVPAGWYTVTAPGGTVTPGKVRVWAGTQSEVAVAFHGIPITGTAVAVGAEFACALTAGGTILCWGYIDSRQLGWPWRTSSDYGLPDAVTGISTATAVSAGAEHACALLSDGTIRCWGAVTPYSWLPTPEPVTGISTATAISGTCALLSDGTVTCWGDMAVSPQGLLPVAVTGISTATAISGTCALLSDGTVTCWDPWTPFAPVSVTGLSSVTAISAGNGHVCALLADGTVRCWGNNGEGQLGDGTHRDSATPVLVKGLRDVTAISAGGDFTCAVLSDGTAKCWGYNDYGQLGNDTQRGSSSPVLVTGIVNATAINAGYSNACAVLSGGSVMCWGATYSGVVVGTYAYSPSPLLVRGIRGATAISAGDVGNMEDSHTCAVFRNGTVRCWGANDSGQLGDGTRRDSSKPVRVKDLRTAIVVSVGVSPVGKAHTCAVLSGGTVRCWGANDSGQLGNGTHRRSSTPVRVKGIRTAIAITAARAHTCAVLSDGTAKCWGHNDSGQLGNGSHRDSSTPVRVKGIRTATEIRTGDFHTCAVLSDGTARCWGENDYGELGNGSKRDSSTPVRVKGIRTATAVTASYAYTCVVLSNRTARCWGANSNGQLGNGTHRHTLKPVRVKGIRAATAISAGGGSTGGGHTCAVLSDGTARCWGNNIDGRLGNGTSTAWDDDIQMVGQPVPVKGISTARSISAGGLHTCALLSRGRVACWGGNASGQLGVSPLRRSGTPVVIEGP